MRRVLMVILFFVSGLLLFQLMPRALAQSSYPSDLSIWAISGGAAPWEELERIEINSTGYSTYWLMTNRTSGEWALNTTFVLSGDNLTFLWNTIQANGFFGLAPNYTDPQWVDGSYCIINITGNGQKNMVMTQNIKVVPFDAVAIAINNVTSMLGHPCLNYNAIFPEWDPAASSAQEYRVPSGGAMTLPPPAFAFGPLACGGLFLCVQRITRKTRKPLFKYFPQCLVLLMIIFLIPMQIVNSVNAQTTVTSGKCHVTVDIYLEFFGSGVTQAFVNQFTKGITDMWNGYEWCVLCTVTFNVHAIITNGGTQPTYDQIEVVHWHPPMVVPRWTATVGQFDRSTGTTKAGKSWCSDTTEPGCPIGYVGAHETGHLMGRPDTYVDVPVDPNDPEQGTYSEPTAGHENDLMAKVWNDHTAPRPNQEHIDGIIRDSNRIPPPFADALPKTIIIQIPKAGRNTGSFSITLSNPTDNDITVFYTTRWTGSVPPDTEVSILAPGSYPTVPAAPPQTLGFNGPIVSVGPGAIEGIYPIEITWHVVQTGATFVTDPYVDEVEQVGGIIAPFDKLSLLAPYIGFASAILVGAIATAVYVKRVKRRKEKQ